jgi:hypothetical protein
MDRGILTEEVLQNMRAVIFIYETGALYKIGTYVRHNLTRNDTASSEGTFLYLNPQYFYNAYCFVFDFGRQHLSSFTPS